MAKRKRRRTKKAKIQISIEIYALILVILAILGVGKFGPVGRLIASFGLFVSGSVYMLFLVLLFIIGIYTFWKRDWPEFFSTKMFGFYLFAIGILTLMHWEFVKVNDYNTNLIFKETLNELVKGFNSLMATGSIGESASVGGGLIGGVFSLTFTKLFSYTGMQIVTWTFIGVGVCMFTGFSIVDFLKDRVEYVKEKKEKHDDKEEHVEENKLSDKKVIISNGNEVEDDNKQVVQEAKLVEEDHTKVEVIDDITTMDDIPFDTKEVVIDNSINDIPTLSKDKDTIEEMFKEEVITPIKDEKNNQKVLDVIGIPDGKKIIRTNDNSNLKENEINHIRTRLYNDKDNSSLTKKEKIRIREVFNLSDDKSYFSSYTVDNAFNINCYIRNILNSNDILNSICNTAINCYLIRMDYLKETDIAYKDLETNRLFNLLGANNTNKLYKVAYDMFMKNLNKLDVNDQVSIRDNFKDKSFDLYRYLFGVNYFKIVSPSDLISLVNIKISEYVIENFEFYTDYSNDDLYLNLFHVTNDMNINEILNVYIGLKNKINKKYGNNVNEYNLRIEKIQENFSIIIDNIINRDKLDINPVDKRKRLLTICEKYLKDEPKFEFNNNIEEKIIYGKNRLEEIINKMNNKNKE